LTDLSLVGGSGISVTPNYSGGTIAIALDIDLNAYQASGKIFSDTAAGLTGTTNGQYFWVPSSGALTLYKNNSGSALNTGYAVPSTSALTTATANIGQYVKDALPRRDLFFPEKAVLNEVYDFPSGAPAGPAPDRYRSDRFPVVAGSAIYFSKSFGSVGLTLVWYDGGGAVISVDQGTHAANTAIPVPSNAREAAFSANMQVYGTSFALNVDPDMKVYDFNPGGAKPRSFGRFAMQGDLQLWTGKKIAILGDSRVKNDLYNWYKRVCVANGAAVAFPDSQGKSDTSRAGRRFDKALYKADDTTALVAGDFAAVDGVLIQIGTNDAAAGMPIGTVTDAAGTTTVHANLRRIWSTLLSWNPTMRIGLVTPYFRTDVPQATTRAYADAYLEHGRYFGHPVLDQCALCGINAETAATWLDGTGIHPKQVGAQSQGWDFSTVNQFDRFLKTDFTPPTAIIPYETVP